MCIIDVILSIAISAVIVIIGPVALFSYIYANKVGLSVSTALIVIIMVAATITVVTDDVVNKKIIDNTVEMVVVDINYDTQKAECKQPGTNTGVLLSINETTPTIEVGDAVSVRLHQKHCSLCNESDIIEHHSEILEVKEVK